MINTNQTKMQLSLNVKMKKSWRKNRIMITSIKTNKKVAKRLGKMKLRKLISRENA